MIWDVGAVGRIVRMVCNDGHEVLSWIIHAGRALALGIPCIWLTRH